MVLKSPDGKVYEGLKVVDIVDEDDYSLYLENTSVVKLFYVIQKEVVTYFNDSGEALSEHSSFSPFSDNWENLVAGVDFTGFPLEPQGRGKIVDLEYDPEFSYCLVAGSLLFGHKGQSLSRGLFEFRLDF